MKARYLYLLLFLLPSVILAYFFALMATGGALGVLWIFIYGDNPWPDSTDHVISAIATISFLTVLTVLSIGAYSFGKRQEVLDGIDRKHAFFTVGGTALLLLMLALQ